MNPNHGTGTLPLRSISANVEAFPPTTLETGARLWRAMAPPAPLRPCFASVGRLLIVDFAPYDHEELRSRDAHVRLGFADHETAGWLDAAGLAGTEPEDLTGGAVTVGLWLAPKRPLATLEAR